MTGRGKLILTLLVLAVLAFGVWSWYPELFGAKVAAPAGAQPAANASANAPAAAASARTPLASPEIVEPATDVPTLDAAAAYQPKGDVFEIELSKYAGYAGLVAANG